jgi:hypothetical protein
VLQEPAKRFSEGNCLADSGLFTPSQRGLTIGLVLVLVVVAFEGLAVTTIMPVTVRELHGLALYAWSFSGFMLGSLVGTVAAGDYTARRGAVFAFTAALAVFAGGLLTCGTANSMTMFIAGRVVEGLGTGAVRSLTWFAINQAYAPRDHVRMGAALSSAYIVPTLVGANRGRNHRRTLGLEGGLPITVAPCTHRAMADRTRFEPLVGSTSSGRCGAQSWYRAGDGGRFGAGPDRPGPKFNPCDRSVGS